MTETIFEGPTPAEPAEPAASETPARRGRPRPLYTVERDNAIAAALAERDSWTRRELAERVGLEAKHVYACLNRLRRTGRAEKVAGNRYRAVRAEVSAE